MKMMDRLPIRPAKPYLKPELKKEKRLTDITAGVPISTPPRK